MIKLFDTYKHVLPRARAWSITINKNLRRFIDGLSQSGDDLKLYFDLIYLDLFPETTRELDAWEYQFNLNRAGNLSEAQRRERLSSVWKFIGGQSPGYIQTSLQDYGFNLYVFDWWVPGSEPVIGTDDPATPRNPRELLDSNYKETASELLCGEPLAMCGEVQAQAGNFLGFPGYVLVNKDSTAAPKYIAICGEQIMQTGETQAQCGSFFSYKTETQNPPIPTDPAYWPYFCYVGGENFGEAASVPANRRDELEDLLISLMPGHLWIGIFVNYT